MILLQEGNWRLVSNTTTAPASVIEHHCSKGIAVWRYFSLREILGLKHCEDCKNPIKESILTLWTLHNWDKIPHWSTSWHY